MDHARSISRRGVLQAGLAAGGLTLMPGWHLSAQEPAEAKQDRLNIGIIGAGGRGRANLRGVSGENIYALCDVNHQVLEKAKAEYPKAKLFHDWRELVGDPSIDAVVVSTADHHHAPASIAAMRAGKHVYCEKPLAHTVQEARWMQDEYRQRKDSIATQMGTQIHATDNYRRIVELVQAGAIGPVHEAHVWCSRTIRPLEGRVLPEQPIPDWFSWDVWLGPAPDRPYNEAYWKGGNLNWNRRWDFGNGVLGDMGSHLIDLAYWALELHRPVTIASEAPPADPDACPPWQVVTWEHPARQGPEALSVPVKVVWYHGPEGMKRRSDYLQPKLGTDTDISKWGIGVAFVGEGGLLVGDYRRHLLSPAAQFAEYRRPPESIPSSAGHHQEWLAGCKQGTPTLCNFEYSGALIEHNLLGNVAHRAGKKLHWDPERMTFRNAKEADRFLTKSYREGWQI